MQSIILSLLTLFAFNCVCGQAPSKQEMQNQMSQVIGKMNKHATELEQQIATARKNKEPNETIKPLEEELTTLKKQIAMMGGLNNSVSQMSDKTIQQVTTDEGDAIPKRDVKRISSLPKQILTDVQMVSYLKKTHAQVERNIPAEEKKEAAKFYEEIKTKWKSAAAITNTASGCWVYGHWEKALYLQGRACVDDPTDPNNLNNYASYLSMVGAEHMALPILQYLDNKYPGNSTIQNNIGQAWFGLGDMTDAKKNLESTIALCPSHSMANLTLAKIYKAEGNNPKAISALKQSIRKAYTSEKESELKDLGYDLDEDDIEFPYKISDDLLGIDPFWNEFPPIPGSVGESALAGKQWDAFFEACETRLKELRAKEDEANKKAKLFATKMIDPSFHQPVLNLHNNNPHNIAGRKLIMATVTKRSALPIEEVMLMAANAYHNTTTQRLNALRKQREDQLKNLGNNATCEQVTAINNNFMEQAKVVMDEGNEAMRKVYVQHKKEIKEWVRLRGYSSLNDYAVRKFNKEVWKANQWIYTYQANFLNLLEGLASRPEMYYPCGEVTEPPKQTKVLPDFKTPGCLHSATVQFPVGKISERCNTINVDESKLKKRPRSLRKGDIILTLGTVRRVSAGEGDVELTMGDPIRVPQEGEVELTMGQPRQLSDAEVADMTVKEAVQSVQEVVDQIKVSQANGPAQGQTADPSSSMSMEGDANGNVNLNVNAVEGQSNFNNNLVKCTINSSMSTPGMGFGSRMSITL